MRLFWLSFVGDEGFRGCCVVEIDEDDIEAARPHLLPQSQPGAELGIAAIRQAYLMGCNPGGQVRFAEITHTDDEKLLALPRHRLFSKAELTAAGVA